MLFPPRNPRFLMMGHGTQTEVALSLSTPTLDGFVRSNYFVHTSLRAQNRPSPTRNCLTWWELPTANQSPFIRQHTNHCRPRDVDVYSSVQQNFSALTHQARVIEKLFDWQREALVFFAKFFIVGLSMDSDHFPSTARLY